MPLDADCLGVSELVSGLVLPGLGRSWIRAFSH